MKLPSGVDLLPDEVKAQLEPGEIPLCAELAAQFAGHSAIGRPTDAAPRMNPEMDWDPVFGNGLTIDPDWAQAKLGGVNAGGDHGSFGDGFSRAFDAGASKILLTDRRLALIADTAGLLTLKTDLRIVVSVDRSAVAEMVRRRRLLQWGRVQIRFVDRSWAMAMLGMFSGRAANRLIAAFGESGARPAGSSEPR